MSEDLNQIGLTRLRDKIKCKQPHRNNYDLDS